VTDEPPASLAALKGISLAKGQIAIWWLGQAGFALHGGSSTVLIDPFLSPWPGRLVPPPLDPRQAEGVDLILVTHEHIDHLDRAALPLLMSASPQALVVVPEPLLPEVRELGVPPERALGARIDVPVTADGVTVMPVPAMHGSSMADAYTFGMEQSGGLYRFLGYVVDIHGVRVYHAGDTILYPAIAKRPRDLRVDVALLPINGRSAEREAQDIVGNLDSAEAAALAARIEADVLIPMHFDMFASNPGFPGELVDVVRREHPSLAVLILDHDRPHLYGVLRTSPLPP
jgi:L-ascorbate 6-phosphate lactonase